MTRASFPFCARAGDESISPPGRRIWTVRHGVIAYRRQGMRRAPTAVRLPNEGSFSGCPCPPTQSPPDQLYLSHLGRLPRVPLGRKRNNFLPTTGFNLV